MYETQIPQDSMAEVPLAEEPALQYPGHDHEDAGHPVRQLNEAIERHLDQHKVWQSNSEAVTRGLDGQVASFNGLNEVSKRMVLEDSSGQGHRIVLGATHGVEDEADSRYDVEITIPQTSRSKNALLEDHGQADRITFSTNPKTDTISEVREGHANGWTEARPIGAAALEQVVKVMNRAELYKPNTQQKSDAAGHGRHHGHH